MIIVSNMKSIKNRIKKAAFSLLTILTFLPMGGLGWALTACNDIVNYNEGYTPASEQANNGAPQISAVYDVTDTEHTSPISEGTLGQLVTIVGRNLNHPTRIAFNTVECDLGEAYTETDRAVVRIPSRLSMEHNNSIEYTTADGTTRFPFVIPFPPLSVTHLSNEFIWAGGEVTVYGKNFDLYDFEGGTSVVTVGSTRVWPTDITSSQMTIRIPEGTPDDSQILLTWEDAEGSQQQTSLPYRPSSHLLYGSFSGVTIATDGSVQVAAESIDGYGCLHFTGSYSTWAWNTIDLSCNMIATEPVIDGSTPDKYVLKFELQTAQNFPVTDDTGLQFSFNWGNSYAWSPADGQGINTFGAWQTVTLPLAPMASNGIKNAGEWQTLRIIFQPHAAYEADFRLANLRIVEK